MKEIDEKYLKEIYLNVLKAIIIILYFFILNASYENVSSEHLEKGIQLLTMIFLFIAIYIFEKAYKKDDGKLAIQGIEILVLSAYTLTTQHITNKYNFDFKAYSLSASYIFAIYFILKSIVIYTNGRRKLVENLSDIREIVKKDEPVKREATKKGKEEVQENVVKNKNVDKNVKTKKNTTKKETTKKEDNKDKKETTKRKKVKKEVKEND